MPTLGQSLGNNIYNIAYGTQYNAMKRKQALDSAGYIPNENDGLLDSFQSGLAGSMGGLFGELAGWSKDKGYDWVNNNAMWASNQMGDIAARNAYIGDEDKDGHLWYGANQAAQALGSSVPSFAADVAMSAAADAAIGSVIGPEGTAGGAIAGTVAGVGKGLYNLYKGTRALQYAGKAGKIAASIAAGGLVENLSNAGDTYMTGLSRGMDHDSAWNASNEAFNEGWAPALLNYASDKAMIGMPMKGIGGAIAMGGGGKVLAKTVGAVAGNTMIGATGESLTEAWQTQIQEQALKNPDYDNIHIYDPNTWTADMRKQAYDAFVGSAMLGGIGGSINATRGYLANRSNSNVTAEDTIDNSVESLPTTTTNTNTSPVVAPPSEAVSEPITDNVIEPELGTVEDLSSVVPDNMVPHERGAYDDVLDKMDTRFKRNKYTDDEITAKNQAVNDTVERISNLWDNSTDEVNTDTLNNKMFIDDFVEAGLTKKEADEASRTMVSSLKSKYGKDKTSKLDGLSLIDRADKVGYQLTDAQRQDLSSSKPIYSNLRSVEAGVKKAELAKEQEVEKEKVQKADDDRRSTYRSRYKNSVNKPFLDATMKPKAVDTGYRIHNAMEEMYADRKANKRPRPVPEYLRRHGITEGNYTKDELNLITSHVKSVQEAKDKRGWNKTQLKKLSEENANVAVADAQYDKATRMLDPKDPRNKEKLTAINQAIAENMIELGKQGKPIYRYKKYTEFKNNNKNLFNTINEYVYGGIIGDKRVENSEKSIQEREKASQLNQKKQVKPKFKKGSIMAKIADNPELKPLITAQSIDPQEVLSKTTQKSHTGSKKSESVNKDEEKTTRSHRSTRTTDAVKGKNILRKFKDEEITPKDAKTELAHIIKNAKKKHLPELQRMMEMLQKNINDKGELRKYDRTEEGRNRDAEIINEHIARFTKAIDDGKVTDKGYESEKKNIEKQIDKFETNHLGDTGDHVFFIPEKPKRTQSNFADEHDAGNVTHPAYVSKAVLERPNTIDEKLRKWVSSELNVEPEQVDFKRQPRERYIKNVLLKEYEDLVESAGGPDEAITENPARAKHLAYAIVGSFPKQSFGTEGNKVKTQRNKAMYNGSTGLTNIKFDGKDKLIAFAKRYFTNDNVNETPVETNTENSAQPKKVDKRKYNGKKVESSVTVESIRATEDPEVFHFVLGVKPDVDYMPVLEEIGIDTGSITNKEHEFGVLSFDAELFISSTPFNGKVNIKGFDYGTELAIKNARNTLLKRVVLNSDNNSVFMNRKTTGGIQDALDKVFDKGEYVVDSDVDGGILIRPNNLTQTEALARATSFQKGTDKLNSNWINAGHFVLDDNVRKIIARGGNNLTDSQAKVILSGIKKRLNKHFDSVISYLTKAKHIQIAVTDAGKTPQYNAQLGVISIPEDKISTSSTALQHELIHAALRDYLNNVGSTQDAVQFAYGIADYIKEEVDGHNQSNQLHVDRNEMSGIRKGTHESTGSRLHEQVLSDGGKEFGSSNSATRSSDVRSENLSNGRSEEGIQRNGQGLEPTSLGQDRQRREYDEHEQAVENNRGNQENVQATNSLHKHDLRKEKLLREWDLAKTVVANTTKDNIQETKTAVHNMVTSVINDVTMNVRDKEYKLLPLLWTAKELDKKFNLSKADSLVQAIYKDNPINLEETIAYTLQGELAPAHTGALFMSASKLTKPNTVIEDRKSNPLRHDIDHAVTDDGKNTYTADTLYQSGTEAFPSVWGKTTDALANVVEKYIKKQNDNIEFEGRDTKQGNIAGYKGKKLVRSPIRFIEKYDPKMKPIVYYAEESDVKESQLQRKYLKKYKKMVDVLGEENREEFSRLANEINDLGREFVQPAGVMVRDKEVYINLKHDDIFREFKEEVDAKNLYNELQRAGKHVFMDFKDGNFRVFASDDVIKPYTTYEQAEKIAKPLRDKIIREKGYNEKVLKAYNIWRELDDMVYRDDMKNWSKTGADPDHRPRRLWAHIPMLHSRYGVYVVSESEDEDGNTYEKRDKVASFHTYQDAEHYVKDKELNKGTRVVITERNPRYDELSTSGIYDELNDTSYDDVIYEDESEEDQEKRFARISHAYSEINKIIEETMGDKDHATREALIGLINDKNKQKELGIDKAKLKEEMRYADLDELFRRRDVITKRDIKGHLLLGYGNLLKDKYNNKRTNAKGANPNTLENMENYLRYKAHIIPKQEFYYRATSLYRDVKGTDYASQYGIAGEGPRRDTEDVVHNFISSVIGIPNNADKALNRTVNEVIGNSWINRVYGENFATDLMHRAMEAVTVAKLGLLRPTAAIAQLGTLVNVVTKTGYTKEFAEALRDATMYGQNKRNVTFSERKMFNRIGLNLNDTAMETQTLKNRKSIYNLKVGKFKLGKLLEMSMEPFNRSDKYTRRVAALHAYRKAIKEGKSQTEAEHIASDFVRATNFDYDDKDASQLFTKFGTIGKLILQFKKYSIKETEFIYDLIQNGDKKEIARFFGSYLVLAGLMGIPGISAGDNLAEWITGKTITSRIKETIIDWAGSDPLKKQLALLTMYGAPAPTIGVDFSRNIGVGDLVPTDNLSGPTLSTLGNFVESFKNHHSANAILLSIGHDLSPAFANYYQGVSGKKHDWSKGVDTRDYSAKEQVLKFIGFRPILDSVDSDISQINYVNSQDKKAQKKAVIYQYINDPKSVSTDTLKEMGITKKNIAETKRNLADNASEKMGRYGSKKEKEENREKMERFSGFEEELD